MCITFWVPLPYRLLNGPIIKPKIQNISTKAIAPETQVIHKTTKRVSDSWRMNSFAEIIVPVF